MSPNKTSLLAKLGALPGACARLVRDELARRRLEAAYPGVHFEHPLNFLVDDYSALVIGAGASIGPFSEIVVLRSAPQSPVPGRLVLAPGVHLGMGANVRAAGGSIEIGDETQIGQQVSLIASNHAVASDGTVLMDRWDPARTGVKIGRRCWIGAHAVILPGVTIGDGALIGAGSIVTKSIPAGQTWHGNPARPAAR